jgi:membrane-bound ClpP family serine protease
MNALLWVALLLFIGLAVMVLEVFVPSGGVLGFISVVAIVAAVVTAFVEQGPAVGLAALALTSVAVPAVLAAAFRWFPDTPLGRRVLPPPPSADDVVPGAERRTRLRRLVGRTGRAMTEMLPWGGVEVDGLACEALAEGGPIAPGTSVQVVGVQGAALVVRVAADPAAEEAGAASAQSSPAERTAAGSPPPLSRTLEEFDFEKLEPPAA